MVEPTLRWVEPNGSSRPLAAVLRELGVSETALAAGAVFVNRQRRTLPDHLVKPQDLVEVYPIHRRRLDVGAKLEIYTIIAELAK